MLSHAASVVAVSLSDPCLKCQSTVSILLGIIIGLRHYVAFKVDPPFGTQHSQLLLVQICKDGNPTGKSFCLFCPVA